MGGVADLQCQRSIRPRWRSPTSSGYAMSMEYRQQFLHPRSRDLAKIVQFFLDQVSIDKFAATEVSEVGLIRFQARIGDQATPFAVI